MRCFNWAHRKLLERVSIASLGLILRKNSDYRTLPHGTRMIARIYRHIVHFRMKHFYFGLFFEKLFYNLGMKMTARQGRVNAEKT
jgi:hypothetical protein